MDLNSYLAGMNAFATCGALVLSLIFFVCAFTSSAGTPSGTRARLRRNQRAVSAFLAIMFLCGAANRLGQTFIRTTGESFYPSAGPDPQLTWLAITITLAVVMVWATVLYMLFGGSR